MSFKRFPTLVDQDGVCRGLERRRRSFRPFPLAARPLDFHHTFESDSPNRDSAVLNAYMFLDVWFSRGLVEISLDPCPRG